MIVGIILILIGGLLLLEKLGLLQNTFEYLWPILMMIIGLFLVWRSRKSK